MTTPVKFWDRVADRYARKPVADEAAYQKKLQVTRNYLRREMEVLEIGCGTGSTAIVHAPHVTHIHATDVSTRMIEIAQGKADAAGVRNVTFETLAMDGIQKPDESLDAVLALSVLHLLEDRADVIARVFRWLKPGGVFVTSTVCLGDTMKWFRFIEPIGRRLGLMPMVRIFSVDELVTSLTDAGFDIDYQWQPGKGDAVFIVATKPAGHGKRVVGDTGLEPVTSAM